MPFPQFLTPLNPKNLEIHRCSTSRRDAPQRILIVKLGALGDILMATPLLTALRKAYPHAHITWIVEQTNVQAIDANPYIDEIIGWDGEHWKKIRSTKPRRWLKNAFGLRWLIDHARLRHKLRGCDIFISFHPEQGLMLLKSARPKTSIGVFQTIRDITEDLRPHYTKAYTKAEAPIHQTEMSLLPLDALGLLSATDKRMTMGYTREDVDAMSALQIAEGIRPGFVVLAPKTNWISKCWPDEHWSALGDALTKEGKQVVLIGTRTEKEAIQRIALRMRSEPVVLSGLLTFRQAAALIAKGSLCISSDSGPMHVAAAVGTPYIALFGPTSIIRYAPLAGIGSALAKAVPCGPCRQEICPNPAETQRQCMQELTVAQVLDAALSTLTPRS